MTVGGRRHPYPLILNLLKDGPPPFRPIRSFPPPLPVLQQVQDERNGDSRAAPLTVLPDPFTVIPAQAGIQDCIAKDQHITIRAFLDSRLRGNDGREQQE